MDELGRSSNANIVDQKINVNPSLLQLLFDRRGAAVLGHVHVNAQELDLVLFGDALGHLSHMIAGFGNANDVVTALGKALQKRST